MEANEDCLPSDDRNWEEHQGTLNQCLQKYFVSGNYGDVSSEEGPNFVELCNEDLNTDKRKQNIKDGGWDGENAMNIDKYMYNNLVKSGVEDEIEDELDKYCTGICSAEEEGVSERCHVSTSRTRNSVNHFNNLISNMEECSQRGATVDTTGDGILDSCGTDILTHPKMYFIFKDLMIESEE